MSNEYEKSNKVGKEVGKFCSKIINITAGYYTVVSKSLASAYEGFTTETSQTVNNLKSNEVDLDECVDKELEEKKNMNSAEI